MWPRPSLPVVCRDPLRRVMMMMWLEGLKRLAARLLAALQVHLAFLGVAASRDTEEELRTISP